MACTPPASASEVFHRAAKCNRLMGRVLFAFAIFLTVVLVSGSTEFIRNSTAGNVGSAERIVGHLTSFVAQLTLLLSVFFLAPLFLLLSTRLSPNSGWLYRTFAVAVILSLLSAKQSVRLVETGVTQHVIYLGFALPIFALVIANLAVTRRGEETVRTWQLRLGPMFAAVLGTIFTLWAVPGAAGPATAAAFGGASLWFLDRRSEGVPAEMVRARADVLTILALAAGLWIR